MSASVWACEPCHTPPPPQCEPETPCEPGHSETTINNGLINVGDVSLLNNLHLLSDNVILNDIDVGGVANGVLGNVLSGNTVGDVLSHNAIANVVTNLLSENSILDHLLGDNTTAIGGVAESGDGDANGFVGLGIFASVEHVLDSIHLGDLLHIA